jgi:predicted MFS family arabinose efflux permease
VKPGTTREQSERRERFERARRDSLKPADETAVLYGWHTVTAALENPARRSLVTDLVAEKDVPNAVGLNSTLMTTSRVFGPALGGLLIAGPGIGWCFAANAVSFVPQVVLFLRMDRTKFRPTVLVA